MDPQDTCVRVGLSLEDDLTLTRVKKKAYSLKGDARDQYLWKTIFRFVCRERAYKSVMQEIGVVVDTNVDLFGDDERYNNIDAA